MTYAQIRRAVLELINQSSVAGTPIAADYNNQSDDIARIPNLINQALTEIRDVYPRRAVFTAVRPGDTAGWASVPLPADCRRILSGGVRAVTPAGPEPTGAYRLLGDGQIWLPPGQGPSAGEYLVEYERFPEQLPPDPPDAYELREDPDVLHAAVCSAAARLVMLEDEFTYAALSNEYETRLARLSPRLDAQIVPIQDVY